MVISLIILMMFPQIALWLPQQYAAKMMAD